MATPQEFIDELEKAGIDPVVFAAGVTYAAAIASTGVPAQTAAEIIGFGALSQQLRLAQAELAEISIEHSAAQAEFETERNQKIGQIEALEAQIMAAVLGK